MCIYVGKLYMLYAFYIIDLAKPVFLKLIIFDL